MDRREFLKRTGLSAAALPLAELANAQPASGSSRVQGYGTLGRTNIPVADISMGTSRLRHGQEDLVRYALDKGVNYFDTADSYTGSQSETVIGNALRLRAARVGFTAK